MKSPHTLSLVAVIMTLTTVSAPAVADRFGGGGNQFTIEFVTIGNPGNPPDSTGDPNPAGSVPYMYRIAQFEVSRDMVFKASAEGNLGLVLHPMDFVNTGVRSAMPATGMTWNEAARFVNWLNTSEGFSPAYNFRTQPGEVGYEPNQNIELWDANDPGFSFANPYRNKLAHYFLPSVHEWYKAAYYDPNAGTYFDFPIASDSRPIAVASGATPGTAVYNQGFMLGPADITETGGLSPWGVMGLGGNVWEWEETDWDLVNDDGSSVRAIRGGSYNTLGSRSWSQLSSSARNTGEFGGLHPTAEEFWVGFRVASIAIPEPSTIVLTALVLLSFVAQTGRKCIRWSPDQIGAVTILGVVGNDDHRSAFLG